MTEGPYRDLGAGFARLTGVEGARRGPSRLSYVEDALLELLRNARDAGARNVFVASSLTRRRFRTLTVIDDGRGVPEAYGDLIFEPGVTTRHLDPVSEPPRAPDAPRPPSPSPTAPHGAGLALYHLREAAVEARLASSGSPTAITATFDTTVLPERTLQSTSRTSQSNLRTTFQTFLRHHANSNDPNPPRPPLTGYYGTPARILATLLANRIIHTSTEKSDGAPDGAPSSIRLAHRASGLGLGLSHRTVQRVIKGEVSSLQPERRMGVETGRRRDGRRTDAAGGPELVLGPDDRARVAAILQRSARAAYLELEDIRVESRPGEIVLRARVYEPEEAYE